MNTRSIWSLIATVAIAFAAFTADGATITASSASLTDVSNAVVSASHGDTVRIPAGTATWDSYLYVTKALSIIGAGTNSTHLTRTNGLLFWLRPSTNLPIRVSQIQFTGGWNDEIIYIDAKRETDASRVTVSSFRVDRCKFNRGKRAIWPLGWAYGVVDHCTFTDCNIAVSPQGDNSAAWARAEGYGTTNSVVIEDNVFITTDSAPSEPNEHIYHYEGGRSTTRFNTFTGAGSTNYYTLPFESHGNYGSGVTDPATTNALTVRGQPVIEVYGNTFAARQTYRFIYLRGGSSLIYSNTFTYTHGSVPSVIQLTDEESWQTSFFSPLKSTRPLHDGITNSFFWANALNGSAVTSASVSGSDTNVIAQNVEYWMQAPNATNGSPAGVLASYQPLAYPHPRVSYEDRFGMRLAVQTARIGTLSFPTAPDPQDPSDIDGLVLWYKPESLSGTNGEPVTLWADSSANGWDMTNSVSGKQPYVTNAVVNGLAAAYFDGGDVLFAEGGALSGWRNVAGATLIAVVRTNSVSSLQGIAFAGRNVSGSSRAYLYSSSGRPAVGGRRLDSDSFASSTAGDLLPGGWSLVEAWIDYSNSDAATYTNGVLAGSTTSFQTDGNTSDTDSAGVCLGGINSTPSEPFTGWIAEAMMFNRSISAADRSVISNYFVEKFQPCSESITQTLDEDYWTINDDFSQRLNITNDTEFCQVTLRVYQSAGAGDLYLELRDGPDPAASSRYGDASATNTVSSATTTNEETFTWSTRPTVPSGSACYLHIRRISGTHRFRACNETGGVGYENTTHAIYTDTGVLGSGTWDFWMRIETR